MKKTIKILAAAICITMFAAVPIYAGIPINQSIAVSAIMVKNFATVLAETGSMESESPESDDMIQTLPSFDAEGNVSLTVTTTEDVVLPVTVTMKGGEGSIKFVLNRNGQVIKIPPNNYRLTKVIDGNGKKLDNGSFLSITEESSNVFLNFTNPNKSKTLWKFVLHNIFFIPVLFLMYAGFRIYKKNNI